jgi:hypothetical protein
MSVLKVEERIEQLCSSWSSGVARIGCLWEDKIGMKTHGPYAPCPRSPTGDHCWHPVGPGVKRCCHCGKISGDGRWVA